MTQEYTQQQIEIRNKQKEIEKLASKAKQEKEKAENIRIQAEKDSEARNKADVIYKLRLEEEHRKKYLEKQKVYETKQKLLEQQVLEAKRKAEIAEKNAKIEQDKLMIERKKLEEAKKFNDKEEIERTRRVSKLDQLQAENDRLRRSMAPVPKKRSSKESYSDEANTNPNPYRPNKNKRQEDDNREDSMVVDTGPYYDASKIKPNLRERQKRNSANQTDRKSVMIMEHANSEEEESTFTISKPPPHQRNGPFKEGYKPEGQYKEPDRSYGNVIFTVAPVRTRPKSNQGIVRKNHQSGGQTTVQINYHNKPEQKKSDNKQPVRNRIESLDTTEADSVNLDVPQRNVNFEFDVDEPILPNRPPISARLEPRILPIETRPIFPNRIKNPENKEKIAQDGQNESKIKHYPHPNSKIKPEPLKKSGSYDVGVQKNGITNVETQFPSNDTDYDRNQVNNQGLVFTEDDIARGKTKVKGVYLWRDFF